MEEDTTGSERADVVTYYRDGTIERKEADTTDDGRFDSVAYYENGVERRQTQDSNADGAVDLVIFLDAEGAKQREELDTTKDGKTDLTRFFSGGRRVREEEDQNADGNPDVITGYDGEDPIVREADTNFDGRKDTTIQYQGGTKVSQEEDRNADGKADARYRFDAAGELSFEELDEDYDGHFEIANTHGDGALTRRTTISAGSGKAKRIEYFEKGQLARAEIDESGESKEIIRGVKFRPTSKPLKLENLKGVRKKSRQRKGAGVGITSIYRI